MNCINLLTLQLLILENLKLNVNTLVVLLFATPLFLNNAPFSQQFFDEFVFCLETPFLQHWAWSEKNSTLKMNKNRFNMVTKMFKLAVNFWLLSFMLRISKKIHRYLPQIDPYSSKSTKGPIFGHKLHPWFFRAVSPFSQHYLLFATLFQ